MINLALFSLQQNGVKNVSQLYLHKILWYADFIADRDLGKSISAIDYQANHNGPTNKLLNVSGFPFILKQDASKKKRKYYSYQADSNDFSKLSFNERAIIIEAAKMVSEFLKNTRQTRFFYDYVHTVEPAYKITKRNDVIPYDLSETIQLDKSYRARQSLKYESIGN